VLVGVGNIEKNLGVVGEGYIEKNQKKRGR
jgi:hypothetical protein